MKGIHVLGEKSLSVDKEFIAKCSSRAEKSNIGRKLIFIDKLLPKYEAKITESKQNNNQISIWKFRHFVSNSSYLVPLSPWP